MKVGVGVISHKRPAHLNLWSKQLLKHLPTNINVKLSYHIDYFGKGIAYGKNKNLKELSDYDYIFLLDSDTLIIKDGWINFFIDAHKESGQHHFLYLTKTQNGIGSPHKPEDECTFGNIKSYNSSNGCFMFLTKEVIKQVGAFDESFGRYGYEHANYTKRIFMSGLNTLGENLCPIGANEYLYCMDFDTYLPFNKKVYHSSSMSFDEIHNYSIASKKMFDKPVDKILIKI